MTATSTPIRRYAQAMKLTLGTTAVALTLLGTIGAGAAGAVSHQSADHCKVLSSTTQTQTRDVTGMTAAATHYGPVRHVGSTYVRTVTRYFYSGTETRAVTTTTTRCQGDVTTSSAATPWSVARVVTSTTTQRVR